MLQIGSEKVHVCSAGRGHTWNDVVVYCENRKLLVTGDIVFLNMHPALYAKAGTSVASWIAILDALNSRYDIKEIVPGHGPVSDKSALMAMKDYFVSIRNTVGNKEKLDEIRKKYGDYFSIPAVTGFGKTVAFIENER